MNQFKDVFDIALEELQAIDTDLHEMAEEYTSNYNPEVIRKVVEIGKLQKEALKISDRLFEGLSKPEDKTQYLKIKTEIACLVSGIHHITGKA